MKLTLINQDLTTAASGETALANGGTRIGAVYSYESKDYVVVSAPSNVDELTAVEVLKMALDDGNFAVE